MDPEDRVYATCPNCHKRVLTVINAKGDRLLIRHRHNRKHGDCPDSFRAVTGLPGPLVPKVVTENVNRAVWELTGEQPPPAESPPPYQDRED